MQSANPSQLFPRVICLTLPEQSQRQSLVVQEFGNVGIANFEFFPGFSKDAEEVKMAYAQGRVKRYPDCFRCGKRDCGKQDCNNILLPVQVAVTLGFQAILKIVAHADEPYIAICEDDIVFAGCAKRVFASEDFQNLVKASGISGEEPTLIRLGHPNVDKASFLADDASCVDLQMSDNVLMSNYFFLANKAFAKLAVDRLNRIDHTADVIIHKLMKDHARCFTLNIPLAADRSRSLGDLPSLIHPKKYYLDYLSELHGESSWEARHEAERLQNHIKKAVSLAYCFIGAPRCGSHYISAFLRKNGLDIGHESLGKDGICAWQYTVSSDNYPYILDRQARSDFFVHADNWFVYAHNPINAIPSLIVDNQKAPLSYAFRREAIYKDSGVNLDDFSSPVEKAARSYAHWYFLALKRKPKAVLRVEHLLKDCRRHIEGHDFADAQVSATAAGSGKPYLGVVHVPVALDAEWLNQLPKPTLKILTDICEILGYRL